MDPAHVFVINQSLSVEFWPSPMELGERIPYLISMSSLIVSGVATFIQAKRIGPVGSGLLSVQGTSFAFLCAILTAGIIVKGQGGEPDEILATIFVTTLQVQKQYRFLKI